MNPGTYNVNLRVEINEAWLAAPQNFAPERFNQSTLINRFSSNASAAGFTVSGVSPIIQRDGFTLPFTYWGSYGLNTNFTINCSNSFDWISVVRAYVEALFDSIDMWRPDVIKYNIDGHRYTAAEKSLAVNDLADHIINNRDADSVINTSDYGQCNMSFTVVRSTQTPQNTVVNTTPQNTTTSSQSSGILDSISDLFRSSANRVDASAEAVRRDVSAGTSAVSNVTRAINTGAETANNILGDTTFVKTATYVVLFGVGALVIVKGIAELRKFISPYSK